MKTIRAPHGTTSIGINGEEIKPDADGYVTVPDSTADHLVESHGFTRGSRTRGNFMSAPVANDSDEVIDDGDLSPMSPKEFSAPMSQAMMKDFLRYHGVAIPRGSVGDLRKVVEDTYAAHGTERKAAPEPALVK